MRWIAFAVTLFAGLTMVSNFKFYSFKTINLRRSYPFLAIFLFVLFFALLSYQPATVLFAMFVAYAISGYAVSAWLAARRRRPGHGAAAAGVAAPGAIPDAPKASNAASAPAGASPGSPSGREAGTAGDPLMRGTRAMRLRRESPGARRPAVLRGPDMRAAPPAPVPCARAGFRIRFQRS